MPTKINSSGQSLTQYDILVGAANNLVTNVAPGVATTVLTSNGVAADPSFQAGGGGGGTFVLIETQTVGAPVSSLDFVTGISSTYATYVLLLTNVKCVTNNSALYMRTSSNGGASYNSTGYNSGQTNFYQFSSNNSSQEISTNSFILTNFCKNNLEGIFGQCFLTGLPSGSMTSIIGKGTSSNMNNTQTSINIYGGYSTNVNVNALRLFFANSVGTPGNMSAGTVSLYGIAQ